MKYFLSVTGDAKKHHECFINHLQQKINLKKVSVVKDSDVILHFCPEIDDYHKRTGKDHFISSNYFWFAVLFYDIFLNIAGF